MRLKICIACGGPFAPASNKQHICESCIEDLDDRIDRRKPRKEMDDESESDLGSID